jgi:hypothetical protein
MIRIFGHKSSFFLLFVGICSLAASSLTAQTPTIQGEKVDYIMPSAEGAALVKAVERQPSLATGVPDISIPIYTIPKTPISINLSYNSSGLLVDELPAAAGLGWRLEVGGMIARVVIGLPDDYETNGYLNRGSSLNDFTSKRMYQYVASDISTLIDIIPNSYDDSPDVFYYDILGYKGKFVLGRDGSAYSYPRNNLKITYTKTASSITKFTVKFPDGTSADFSSTETCLVTNYPPLSAQFSTLWSLASLKSESQNIAVLKYDYPHSYTLTDFKAEERQFLGTSGIATNFTQKYTIKYTCIPISEIKTTDTKVLFDYLTNLAVDFASSTDSWYALKNIRVNFSQLEDPVDYYTSPLQYLYLFHFNELNESSTNGRKNFLLSDFKIIVPGTVIPYVFEYNLGTDQMPALGSTSVDLWGYYNGASNGTSIIPNLYGSNGRITSIPMGNSTPLRAGANRSSHEDATKIGVLKSITSPEGLRTEYDYELNSFLFSGDEVKGAGLRLKSLKKYDGSNLLSQEDYTYQLLDNSTTSGILLYHSTPAIGTSLSNAQLTPSNWNNKNAYIKTSYSGEGSVPFQNTVYYSKVKVSKGNLGCSLYTFGLPVERTNPSVLPSALNWVNTEASSYLFEDGTNSWALFSESDPTTPSLFHLWTTPLLLNITDKNQTNDVVKNITFSYDSLELTRMVSGLKLLPTFKYTILPTSSFVIHSSKSYFLSAWRELLSQTETVYNPSGAGGIARTSQFEYTRPEAGIDFSFVKQVEAIAVAGESVITKYKYCFDPMFSFSALVNDQMSAFHDSLETCLDRCRTYDPSRVGSISSAMDDCYNAYDLSVAGLVSPEARAINLLKEKGSYSNPIEVMRIASKNSVKTVVSSQFSIMMEQTDSHQVLPVTNYFLSKPVPETSFVDLRISTNNSQGNFNLDFDDSYSLASEVTKYSGQGEVLETRGRDGVYTSFLYSAKWDTPVVNAANCRYDNIKNFSPDNINESMIRTLNPNAMITTSKYFFPLGVYQSADPRGRISYTIYNTLGEIIGVKDHDKNLRAVNLKKRVKQEGTPSVLISTEPDGDYTLNVQSVGTYRVLNVDSWDPIDMSHPVGFSIDYTPAYSFSVVYSSQNYGTEPEEPITTNSFTHKFKNPDTYSVTVLEKLNGQTIYTFPTKSIAIVRNPMSVSYSELNNVNGYPMKEIIPRMLHGTGEYTITWQVSFTSSAGIGPTFTTYTQTRSGSGSTADYLAVENGYYEVSVTIEDGSESFQNSWSFTVGNGFEQ